MSWHMWGLRNLADMLSGAKPPTADVEKVERSWEEVKKGWSGVSTNKVAPH